MAKHRLETPGAGRKVATTAVVAGSIAIGGSFALAGGQADAAPINIPGVGTFDVPDNLIPEGVQVPSIKPPKAIGTPQQVRAQEALRYAESKIGSPYVYGAAGPNAFDCSGLTMMAWAQAGVGLPHSSSAQMGSGARVSSNNLKPGDLVFYYSPVSHVGIYIGNGQIVHAANPGTGVVVAGVFSMPFSGAVRPG